MDKICWTFDCDGVICLTEGTDYEHSVPRPEIIAKINKLYDSDRYIKIFTGRGSVSGKDWRDLTEKQLKEWGVKYHQLLFSKPHYDIFIDDHSWNIEDFEEFVV